MSYIQGFVLAVPKDKKQEYIEAARSSAVIFQEYGATRIVEAWSEDVPDGKVSDFKKAVQAKPDEAIVFSWIEWPDKPTWKAASDKMETDPRWKEMAQMPPDGSRMIWGGFDPIFEA